MKKSDRQQQLIRIFQSTRSPLSKKALSLRLECSEKTVSRYIDELRDFFGATLEYHQGEGWQIDRDQPYIEMPGFWLTQNDIQSLLLLLDMLQSFGHGLLSKEFSSINGQITKLLSQRNINRSELEARVRIIPIGHRATPNRNLYLLFEGIMLGKKVSIDYCDFEGQESTRSISPQRLLYYRDNWYIDAWCHLKRDLRSFSLARINGATLLKQTAKKLATNKMKDMVGNGYGLFTGKANKVAVLRFNKTIAREISIQHWHSKQTGSWDASDYILKIPYADDRELIQDILRLTPNVIVEAPEDLRVRLIQSLKASLAQHS